MIEHQSLRGDVLNQLRELVAIETAVRALFRELDNHCPDWRTAAMASGEGTDGVNRAWRALSSVLGESSPCNLSTPKNSQS
jgi:hypothetical protein